MGRPPWDLPFKKQCKPLPPRSFLTTLLGHPRLQLCTVLYICVSECPPSSSPYRADTNICQTESCPNLCTRVPAMSSHGSESGPGHLCSSMEMNIMGVTFLVATHQLYYRNLLTLYINQHPLLTDLPLTGPTVQEASVVLSLLLQLLVPV